MPSMAAKDLQQFGFSCEFTLELRRSSALRSSSNIGWEGVTRKSDSVFSASMPAIRSALSASCRSRSISPELMRRASPYQISLVREKGKSSRRDARRIAALTLSPAERGSAHRCMSV